MHMAKQGWPAERFGAILDQITARTGRSQGELAALVPMNQSQFSRWRSGTARPKYDSLSNFADALLRAHPSVGISKQEILAAGGYEDVLVQPEPPRVAGTAHDATVATAGDMSWFLENPPDEMRLGVDWDTLTAAEKWAYHTPGFSPKDQLKNRSVMAMTVRTLLDLDAPADTYVEQALRPEPRRDQHPNSA